MTWYQSLVSVVHGCSRELQRTEITLMLLKNTQSSVPACDQSSSEGFKPKSLGLYLSSAGIDFADFQPSGLFVATVVDYRIASFFCGATWLIGSSQDYQSLSTTYFRISEDFFQSSLDIRGKPFTVICVFLKSALVFIRSVQIVGS